MTEEFFLNRDVMDYGRIDFRSTYSKYRATVEFLNKVYYYYYCIVYILYNIIAL